MKNVMKKFLSCAFVLFLASAAVADDYSDYRSLVTTGYPQSVLLAYYDGPDTRGFAWQTNGKTAISGSSVWVLPGVHTADADFDAATPVTAASDQHTSCVTYLAHVTDLEPGHYSYRVGGSGKYAYGQFDVRAENEPVTIFNVSDVQTKDATKIHYWDETVSAMSKIVANPDFIISNGDFYDSNGPSTTTYDEYVRWGVVADKANVKFTGTAWVLASGNHDPGTYYKTSPEHYQFKPTGDGAGCHAFVDRGVFVAAIPYINAEQTSLTTDATTVYNWLEAQLATEAAQNATWRIVVMHAGPYTTADHGWLAKAAYVKRMAGICTMGHVDLCLQGHDHTYSKTLPYWWDKSGFTESENNTEIVNYNPEKIFLTGSSYAYDRNPNGTYFVSCACSGSRFNEGSSYATRGAGTQSYDKRSTSGKIITSTVQVQSSIASIGHDGSMTLPNPSFAVIQAEDLDEPMQFSDGKYYAVSTLTYDWYTSSSSGNATLFDTLRIAKTVEVAPPIDPSGSDDPVEVTLDPGEEVSYLTISQSESWSYEVTGTTDWDRYIDVELTVNDTDQARVAISVHRACANPLVVSVKDSLGAVKKTITLLSPLDPSGSDDDVTITTIATGIETNFITITTADAWLVDIDKPAYVMTVFETNQYGQASLSLRGLYTSDTPITVRLYADKTVAEGTPTKTIVINRVTAGEGIVDVASSNVFAMVEVAAPANAATIIPIPWSGYTETGLPTLDERIDHVVWPYGLAEDDMILAVTNGYSYAAWSLESVANEAGAHQWAPIATAVRMESVTNVNQAAVGGKRSAIFLENGGLGTVMRGSGVWLVRQNTSAPFTLLGQYTTGPATVTVPGGSETSPVCVMLANPLAAEGIDINKDIDWSEVGVDAKDTIIVTTGQSTSRYYMWNGTDWYYAKTSYNEETGDIETEYITTLDKLPAGCGFWYVRRTAGEITVTIGK